MKSILLGSLFLVAFAADASARRRKPDPVAVQPKTDPGKLNEDQRKNAAMKLVGEARVLFDKGTFPEAAQKFEEAYRLFPKPKMNYNIGLTWDAMKKSDRALCALQHFVADAKDADPTLLADSQQRIEKLRKIVGRVEVEAPAGAALFVDGDERAIAPASEALCVEQGKRRIVALVTGSAPVGIDVDVKAEKVIKVALDPATNSARQIGGEPSVASVSPPADATQPAAPPAGPSTPIYKKWWFWTAVGGAVVVGATAIGLGVGLRPVDVTPPGASYGPFPAFP